MLVELEAARLPTNMILVRFIAGMPPYLKGQSAAFVAGYAQDLVKKKFAEFRKVPPVKAAK